jgi:hypothetical protein
MLYFSDSLTDKTFWYGYQTGTVMKRGFVEYTEVSSINSLSCADRPELASTEPFYAYNNLPGTLYLINNTL